MQRDYQVKLTANQTLTLNVEGDFYRFLNTDGLVSIRFDESVFVQREAGQAGAISYKSVTLLSTIDQTIRITLGFGIMFDDRSFMSPAQYPTCSPYTPPVTALANDDGMIVAPSNYRDSITFSTEAGADSVLITTSTLLPSDTGNANIGFTVEPTGVWLHGGGSVTMKYRGIINYINMNPIDVKIYIMTISCEPQQLLT